MGEREGLEGVVGRMEAGAPLCEAGARQLVGGWTKEDERVAGVEGRGRTLVIAHRVERKAAASSDGQGRLARDQQKNGIQVKIISP